MSISEAFELYCYREIQMKGGSTKTHKNYITAMRSFIIACGDVDTRLITRDSAYQWMRYMDSMSNSQSTIQHQLCCLRSVLKFLYNSGHDVIRHTEIELPKRVRTNPAYVEPQEVIKLMDATTNKRDRALIACLFATGCRISELLNVNVQDVKDREILVLGKNSKYRTVYLSPAANAALQSYLDTRKDNNPALFISGQYRRITASRVAQILHVATSEAKLDKIITPHTFRHGFATDLVRNGANLLAVKELLGHESIQTTQIYTHSNKPYLKESHYKYHTNLTYPQP